MTENNNNNNNNSNDQAPYLSVGTEVSAKFKGAFCEAKIKSIQKLVKCKVLFKHSGEQCVITDENIRNNYQLKVGQNCDARRSIVDTFEQAQLLKVQDLSTYTVVFNDGDERTLKRSFLRFKGERHYQDSETLNNSPLTHPEHFSNPVKTAQYGVGVNGISTKQQSLTSTDLAELVGANEKDYVKIGSLIFVQNQKKILYPGVILKIRMRKKTVIVRNFKDFKTSIVRVIDICEYRMAKLTKQEQDEMKDLLDMANNYLQNGQLPKGFSLSVDDSRGLMTRSVNELETTIEYGQEDDFDEESVNYSDDTTSNVDVDDAIDDVMDEIDQEDEDDEVDDDDDEEDNEVKDRFVAQLYKFMDDRDTPINKLPIIENCDLDLYKLFTCVKKFGGYNKVTKLKHWSNVYKKLNLPNLISANVVHLKSAYKRYLHPYEEFDRKLGTSICDIKINNSIRSSVDSHRSLHLFKHRLSANLDSNKKTSRSSTLVSMPKVKVKRTSSTEEPVKASVIATTQVISTPIAATTMVTKKRHVSLNETTNATNKSPSGTTSALLLDYIEHDYGDYDALNNDDSNNESNALTLTSMVKNINETIKKQKKQQQQQQQKRKSQDGQVKQHIPPAKRRSLSDDVKKDVDESVEVKSDGEKKKKFNTWSQQRKLQFIKKMKNFKEQQQQVVATPPIVNDEKLKNSKIKQTRPSNSSNSSSSTSTLKVSSSTKKTQDVVITKQQQQPSNDESSDDLSIKNVRNKRKSETMKLKSTDTENETIGDVLSDINRSDDGTSFIDDWKDVHKNYTFDDLEVNKIVDVKYGNYKLKKMYEAKIVKIDLIAKKIFVHYTGWNNRYDEWIELNRIYKVYDHEGNSKRRKRSKGKKGKKAAVVVNLEVKKEGDDEGEEDCGPDEDESKNDSEVQVKSNDEDDDELDDDGDDDETDELNKSGEVGAIVVVEQDVAIVSIKNEFVEVVESHQTSSNVVVNEVLDSEVGVEQTKTQESTDNNNAISIKPMRKKRLTESSVNKYEIFRPSVKMPTRKEATSDTQSQYSIVNILNVVEDVVVPKSEYDFIEDISESENENNNCNHASTDNEDPKAVDSKIKSNEIESNVQPPQPQQQQPLSSSASLNLIITNSNSSFTTSTTANVESEQEENIQPNIQLETKFVFQQIDKNIIGEERIRLIEEQMRECRKAYLKLKNEVSVIDRKRKKYRKKMLTKQQNNQSITKIDTKMEMQSQMA